MIKVKVTEFKIPADRSKPFAAASYECLLEIGVVFWTSGLDFGYIQINGLNVPTWPGLARPGRVFSARAELHITLGRECHSVCVASIPY